MSPERWHRVRALFEEIIEQPTAERAAILDRVCADDVDLRADLKALLAADAEAASLISSPLDRYAGDLVGELFHQHSHQDAHHVSGRRVGPYRLLSEIGRGGMGAVYLGERADGQFEQRVALKLVKGGMESDFMLQRFLRERQILARLQHPNIARLYDGGVTDSGQPYFAMEYVEGVPLTSYCDSHGLGVEERLHLFLVAAGAVQFAHRNLVVHRDLKPSNILVAATESATGSDVQVKLLDFGIAKLLSGGEAAGADLATGTGMHLMTPAYASPEQVRGEAITTATDVYSLGVVLYELLCGRRPYFFRSQAPDVVANTIVSQQPVPPSAAVSTIAEAMGEGVESDWIPAAAIARQRGTSEERLRRRLAGDLDTICLMALRKEPERRYPSVEAMAEDLRRHLTGLPVSARRDTVAYRVTTFVRRHKLGMAAAALVIVSLVTGLGASLWQASVARREQQEKHIEATRANMTRDYLVGLFENVDPYEAQGRRFTARDLIGPGIRRLQSLAGQPLERAAVMRVLGEVAVSVGLLATADSLFKESLTLQESELPPDHPEIAATMEGRASALLLLREHSTARDILAKALAIRRQALGPDDPAVLKTLNQLAYVLSVQNDVDAAEERYLEALSFRDRASGALRAEIARSLRGIADLYVKRGRLEAAKPIFREALVMYERSLGATHTETGRTLYSLAQVLRISGDFEQSDSLFSRALQISDRVYGRRNYRAATILYELGLVKQKARDYDEARRYFEEAAAIYDEVLPDDHIFRAYPLQELGLTLLVLQGRPDEAEAPLRRALAIYEAGLPDDDLALIKSRLELAACLARLDRHDKADSLLLVNYDALSARADTSAPAADLLAQTVRGLARLADARGDPRAAAGYDAALRELSGGE